MVLDPTVTVCAPSVRAKGTNPYGRTARGCVHNACVGGPGGKPRGPRHFRRCPAAAHRRRGLNLGRPRYRSGGRLGPTDSPPHTHRRCSRRASTAAGQTAGQTNRSAPQSPGAPRPTEAPPSPIGFFGNERSLRVARRLRQPASPGVCFGRLARSPHGWLAPRRKSSFSLRPGFGLESHSSSSHPRPPQTGTQ